MRSSSREAIHLVLFMTRNVSLQTWEQIGSFEREVAIYQAFQSMGHQVSIVSYGTKKDLKYQSCLGGINILCNRWNLPLKVYEKLLPWLHGKILRTCDVIKTNQMNGAETALRAAQVWRKPFIARCGFLFSLNTAREQGEESPLTHKAVEVERNVFSLADLIFVTTSEMQKFICEKYSLEPMKIKVVPNYVDTQRFRPINIEKKGTRKIVFVGRLSFEKNLENLLYAIEGLDIQLQIVGSGGLSSRLNQIAQERRLPVSFLGNIPNRELPTLLNEADIFILPSLYEGHPKALLEAMSCGLPVIGTNSPGIREILVHQYNGYLCGLSSEEIRDAITNVMSNEPLRLQMGINARQYILENCSLDKISNIEIGLIKQLIGLPE